MTVTNQMKDNHEKRHRRAQSLFNANRLTESVAVYKQICAANPDDIQAWHMSGAIFGMLGDFDSARACCERVIALNPGIHGAYLNLGNILLAKGDLKGAEKQFRQALDMKPDDAQTLTALSGLLIQTGRFDKAIDCLGKAIAINPDFAEAHNNLGTVYKAVNKIHDAKACFLKALEIRPDYIDALCNMGAVNSDLLEYDNARNCYNRALRLSPGNPLVLRNLGNLHQSTGDYDSALACYQQAINAGQPDITLLTSLASLLERCGKLNEAGQVITPVIQSGQANPEAVAIHAKLCKKSGNLAEPIQLIEAMLDKPVTGDQRVNLHFCLGDLYESKGDYDAAFKHYKKANETDAVNRESVDYLQYFRSIMDFHTPDTYQKIPSSGNTSDLPIFIIGMPRTGTSLVEQILASHPDVYAGGERSDSFRIIDAVEKQHQNRSGFPDVLLTLEQSEMKRISDEYITLISTLSRGKKRYTDKTPLHGLHLGFIKKLLPNSRIVLCRRNPLDTCLSIYFNRFNSFHSYASDLTALGMFHNGFYKLVQHYTDTLRIEVLELQYESLVQDPEPWIRKLVEFCDLEWNDACLHFHKTDRVVNTPSYDQVRQPMYTSSVNRWKHYESFIAPLKLSLDARL